MGFSGGLSLKGPYTIDQRSADEHFELGLQHFITISKRIDAETQTHAETDRPMGSTNKDLWVSPYTSAHAPFVLVLPVLLVLLVLVLLILVLLVRVFVII